MSTDSGTVVVVRTESVMRMPKIKTIGIYRSKRAYGVRSRKVCREYVYVEVGEDKMANWR